MLRLTWEEIAALVDMNGTAGPGGHREGARVHVVLSSDTCAELATSVGWKCAETTATVMQCQECGSDRACFEDGPPHEPRREPRPAGAVCEMCRMPCAGTREERPGKAALCCSTECFETWHEKRRHEPPRARVLPKEEE